MGKNNSKPPVCSACNGNGGRFVDVFGSKGKQRVYVPCPKCRQ